MKIAVGKVGEATIIALPGPTEEVKPCLEPVIQGLLQRLNKHELANKIVDVLRKKLIKRNTNNARELLGVERGS